MTNHDVDEALTEEDILAIEQRVQAATPGTWTHHEEAVYSGRHGRGGPEVLATVHYDYGAGRPTDAARADAAFIAHAREDVQALLEDVRRLRDENASLRRSLAKYHRG